MFAPSRCASTPSPLAQRRVLDKAPDAMPEGFPGHRVGVDAATTSSTTRLPRPHLAHPPTTSAHLQIPLPLLAVFGGVRFPWGFSSVAECQGARPKGLGFRCNGARGHAHRRAPPRARRRVRAVTLSRARRRARLARLALPALLPRPRLRLRARRWRASCPPPVSPRAPRASVCRCLCRDAERLADLPSLLLP